MYAIRSYYDPCGRIQFGVPNDSNDNEIVGKIDYTINNSQTLTGRYLYARYANPVEYDGTNILQITRVDRKNQVHASTFGHNWILSSSAVNALHVTYNHTINDRTLPEFFENGGGAGLIVRWESEAIAKAPIPAAGWAHAAPAAAAAT